MDMFEPYIVNRAWPMGAVVISYLPRAKRVWPMGWFAIILGRFVKQSNERLEPMVENSRHTRVERLVDYETLSDSLSWHCISVAFMDHHFLQLSQYSHGKPFNFLSVIQ